MTALRTTFDEKAVSSFHNLPGIPPGLNWEDVDDSTIPNLIVDRTYLLFLRIRLSNDGSTQESTFRVTNDGAEIDGSFMQWEPGRHRFAFRKFWVHHWWQVVTVDGDIKAQVAANVNAGIDSTHVEELQWQAIDLTEMVSGTDYHHSFTGLRADDLTSPATKVVETITFTPSLTEDYLVLTKIAPGNTSKENIWASRLIVDGVEDSHVPSYQTEDNSDKPSYGVYTVLNLDNTSHTLEAEIAQVGTGSQPVGTLLDTKYSEIIAIRLDSFEGYSHTLTPASIDVDGGADGSLTHSTEVLTHTHTVVGKRRLLVLCSFLWQTGSNTDVHIRFQADDVDALINQASTIGGNVAGSNQLSHWRPADFMPGRAMFTVETDADLKIDIDAQADNSFSMDVTERLILVIDLGPAPTEGGFSITDDEDVTPGISFTDKSALASLDPIETIELFLLRSGIDTVFTYAEFVGFFDFLLISGDGSDLSINALTNDTTDLTLNIIDAMPNVNEWYHLVLRHVGLTYTAYCGRTGVSKGGGDVGDADVFPIDYATDAESPTDDSDGFLGIGISLNELQTAIGQTDGRIGGPAVTPTDADSLNGAVSEFRMWDASLSDSDIEAQKTQHVRYDSDGVAPFPNLWICTRMNEDSPVDRDDFAFAGRRQLLWDTHDGGGGSVTHPFIDVSQDVEVLRATMAGVGAMTADLTPEAKLVVTMAGVGAMTADVVPDLPLAATMAGVGAMTADAFLTIPLAALMAGVGVMDPTLRVSHSLEATMAGAGAMTAALFVDNKLEIVMAGVGSMTADLQVVQELAVVMAGVGAMTADLNLEIPLAATMAGVAAMTAELFLTVPLAVEPAFGARGTSDMTADLKVELPLVVTMAGTGAFTANLRTDQRLAALMAGSGSMTANLVRALPLAVTMAGTGAMTAGLTPDAALVATMAGVGAMTAALTPVMPLAIAAAGAGAMSADLTVDNRMAVVMGGSGSMDATLTRSLNLFARFRGQSAMSADLTVVPVGGVGAVLDSVQVSAAVNDAPASSSAYERNIHGQFVIPASFLVNNKIRIAVVPGLYLLTTITIDFDPLASGSGLMQVGTDAQPSAYIGNVDITAGGIEVMTSPRSAARVSTTGRTFIVLSFSGALSFVEGAAIRLVGNAIHMPTLQEDPR